MKYRFVNTTGSKHSMPVAENLLDRKFDVSQPNRYWVSDITYSWTATGWLYLTTVMDLYSRRIIDWSMDTSMSWMPCLWLFGGENLAKGSSITLIVVVSIVVMIFSHCLNNTA